MANDKPLPIEEQIDNMILEKRQQENIIEEGNICDIECEQKDRYT